MAEPTTWTELKANVADWLNRSDLTTQIPEFIGYAERRFNRVLRVPEMEDSVTASSSAATITLPANVLQVRSIYISSEDPTIALEQLPIWDLKHLYRDGDTGEPAHYAIQSGNELVFGPTPDASYTYILNYYEKIPALGASQADNWLLTAHPDIYLAATLAEAFSFLRDEERMSVWEQKASGRVAELNQLALRRWQNQGPKRLRTDLGLIGGSRFNINTGL